MIKPVRVKMSQVAFTPKLFGAEKLVSFHLDPSLGCLSGVDGVRAEFDTRSFSVRSRCKHVVKDLR